MSKVFPRSLKAAIKKALKTFGLQVGRYDLTKDADAVLALFLKRKALGPIFDIGANSGQYARYLRNLGYSGTIISFEPQSHAFQELREKSSHDSRWHIYNLAIGDDRGTAFLNISENSWSSSLLPVLPAHLQIAPESAVTGTETVNVIPLDEVFYSHVRDEDRPFLKIDAQGHTMPILRGATNSLKQVEALQVELSLLPLYGGEALMGEVLCFLYERGFCLYYIEPELTDGTTGQQIQVNGLFCRLKDAQPAPK